MSMIYRDSILMDYNYVHKSLKDLISLIYSTYQYYSIIDYNDCSCIILHPLISIDQIPNYSTLHYSRLHSVYRQKCAKSLGLCQKILPPHRSITVDLQLSTVGCPSVTSARESADRMCRQSSGRLLFSLVYTICHNFLAAKGKLVLTFQGLYSIS